VFRDLFEVFSAGGHAKLLAWLAIEASNQPDPDPERQSRFTQLVDACAAQLPGESLEAVRNLVTTAVCAAIGLGVAGEPLMALVNMNAEQRAAFPDWIADRLGLGAEAGDGTRAG
jgi:hypothetical protein